MAVDLDQTKPARIGASHASSEPVVIEATGIEKTFRIPEHRVDSIKERVLSFSGQGHRELRALRGISFDVHRGEFFGIVGRNGSGKSTLLKILASIYKADAGRVRMAGRLAPFIELGVGFNPELTARENVQLNGVMLGLSRREARRRLGAVLDFAELEEFVGLKLKNYSSGMLVRLAFSVMIQSDADILLIDEVLAVGDASFQQKCADVFHAMRDSDRTVVLVTHDMAAVEEYCHRAMLLHGGEVAASGDPGEVASDYLRLNFQTAGSGQPGRDDGDDVSIVDAWIEGADGARVPSVEVGGELVFCATVEAHREIEGPMFAFTFNNGASIEISGFCVELPPGGPDRLAPGQRVQIRSKIENQFSADRYTVRSWIHRHHRPADLALYDPHVLDFVVYGKKENCVVMLNFDVDVEVGAE